MEVELFPPDPELVESTLPEPDHLEGLMLRMTQAMNHYQREEQLLFHVWGDPGHFMWECPHCESFPHLAQTAFKLPGGGPDEPDAHSKEQSIEVVARVISNPVMPQVLETGPTMRWVGLETLVDMVLEGCSFLALADSGSQVNTMMPEFVRVWGYPVLPLEKLVDYPLHLVGLGSQCTHPLGFIIVRLQVKEVVGYDEDVVFLVIPDESAFSSRVPLVIGTCMLGCIINIIKESELDQISTPWATVCLAQMLS